MNYSTYRISLDIHKPDSNVVLNAKRGDTNRKIFISLTDGSVPYHISEECYAVFTATKPDGKIVYNECTIEDCVIIYKFTDQTVAAEGMMDCEIKLYGADNELITSPRFIIMVHGTVYDEGDEVESSDEFSALTKLVADAQQAADKANGAAEKAAHTAKNLMVVGQANGSNIYLDDATDQYLVGLRIFGKTTQDGTPTPDAPVDAVSSAEGGSITVRACGKNLLQCTAASATTRGIGFAVNLDGTILANGTASENAYLTVGQVKLHPGTYFLNGDFSGSSTTHRVFITDGVKEYNSYTADRVFTVEETSTWSVRILIQAGQTVNNLKFAPMVRLASIADNSYERHMTATEMSVTASDKLRGIPVSSGGNYTDASGQQWICDEIDLVRRVYIKRVGIKIFDGSNDEYWYAENPLANTSMFRIGILDGVNAANVVGKDFVCSHFAPDRIYSVDTEGAQHSGYQFYFRILNSRLTSENVGGFQAFLAASPVSIMYVLEVPVEIPLSAEDLAAYATLRTYRGNTTVSNDASAHMEIEYVMDARKYIDSMISGSILAATVE